MGNPLCFLLGQEEDGEFIAVLLGLGGLGRRWQFILPFPRKEGKWGRSSRIHYTFPSDRGRMGRRKEIHFNLFTDREGMGEKMWNS